MSKTILFLITIITFFTSLSFAEKTSIRIGIFPAPPNISADVKFTEPSGNNILDAEETGKLTITVKNIGKGDAFDVRVEISADKRINDLRFNRSVSFGTIPSGKSVTEKIKLAAGESLPTDKVSFTVDIEEANGFDADPLRIAFKTKAFEPPKLVVADIGIEDQNGNSKIEPMEMVELTARIQNIGHGDARDVVADIEVGRNVYIAGQGITRFKIGSLRSGMHKDIKFMFYTNKHIKNGAKIPIEIKIKEKRPQFEIVKELDLKMNARQKRTQEIIVKGIETPIETPKGEIKLAGGLSVDVDMNIPTTRMKNPDAIAIVLGIEHYRYAPSVSYARRDAAVFKEYAVKVLGVPNDRNHIYLRTDDEVTQGEFNKLFTGKGWLAKRAQPTSDVYIYYAGHGAPQLEEKSAYLIPYDGDPNYPQQTGFKLGMLYEELAKLDVRSVTVFIDACFSGTTRENKTILADARNIIIQIDNPALLSEKIVALSAAGKDQISSGYPEKRHGLFTYYLLKGLRGDADSNKDKALSIEELETYLIKNVSKTAGFLDREQTPQVTGKNKTKVLVRY